ncbi:ABC transporter ATP-binding protein [Propionivibrio sp.]|uniref:ABC transporter ATP-binding protein n=1 Tax=Propionivibrio sp. TaxID=2212460 RepID=UPI0039E2A51E
MKGLTLRNVSRRFDGLLAVGDVSFSVRPGRVTGLIGPNGAGKTTVVNLISGLLLPTQGTIHLDGEDISAIEPAAVARRGIARTFQTIRLLKEASVLDNVAAGFHRHERSPWLASLLGTPAARREAAGFRERAAALLRQFNMLQYAGQLAGNLSYGHQRRVEMMRALATGPRLLLLDEPVAGMNDREADALGEIFAALAADGLAVLLIEHNMRFVMSLCRELHVLDAGRLIASGEPQAVRAQAAVIAAYLGS